MPEVEPRRRWGASKPSQIASGPETHTTKIHTRVALMNRFSALGNAEIVRVA